MEYSIISINESRAENKALLRKTFASLKEANVKSVNASNIKELALAWKDHPGIRRASRLRTGEIGIWLSVLNNWKYMLEHDVDSMIVLEDDAIPEPDALETLHEYMLYLPEDYDLLSLWVPDNQRKDFYQNYTFDWNGKPLTVPGGPAHNGADSFRIDDSILAMAYQGYGGVATLYSKKGAEKFYTLTKGEGLSSTCDCFLFIQVHRKLIKGYAPRPDVKQMFGYNWKAPTSIQNTPYVGND